MIQAIVTGYILGHESPAVKARATIGDKVSLICENEIRHGEPKSISLSRDQGPSGNPSDRRASRDWKLGCAAIELFLIGYLSPFHKKGPGDETIRGGFCPATQGETNK